MKIAIPVENGRLHSHFGGCRDFALVEVDADQKLALRTEIVSAPEHRPGLFPRWLRELGVQVVIAGGIGGRALAHFAEHGISVRAGVDHSAVEPLIAAYLSGQLTASPEHCDHHGHHRLHHEHDLGHDHGECAEDSY
jgi:predicted Fe-Mo cluster-binding NifX family protein